MKVTFSTKLAEAMAYALEAHNGRVRKKTGMPYIAHLMGVASIVLEFGGTEMEAIAALLHDAVEDAGGEPRLEDIRLRFGNDVALIVEGCTDSKTMPRPPWRERKEAYLEHLPHASPSVLLVSSADKLHNARSLLRTLRNEGSSVWKRYSGEKDGTLWYYRALVQAFSNFGPKSIARELDYVVSQIESLARE